MENFLSRLARNPYAPIDGASVTRVDELGNGYDDWNNLIAPKYTAPEQTWGETALGVATAPARLATALAGSLSPYGADGWQVPPIINEGADALTAVGDAYTGKMAPEEIPGRALGMAGFMMGGGGPALALERSLAQRGISSTADMIPTGVKDYGQAAYRSIRYPHETPVIGPMSDMDIWQRFGMSTREGKDLNNAPFWEEPDGTLNMLYPDGPDTYAAFSGPNRLANEPGVPGDVNAYKAKPVRPDIEVIDGGLLDRLSSAYAPDNQLNMFGGRNAKTANLERLAIAERLAAEGADRRAIWDQTGWFKGPDQKWRFEIDDSGSSVRNSFMDAVRSGSPSALMDDQATSAFGATYTNADNLISHPALFDAYPEARGVSVGASVSDTPFAQYGGWDRPDHIQIGAQDAGGFRKSALHEMQHDLQRREGFAYGGTATEGDGIGYLGQSRPDIEADYNRLAGEVEARNIQKRMNMSADERRATPPWETQDIPDADQIVRLYSNADSRPALLAGALGQEPDIPDWLLPYLPR